MRTLLWALVLAACGLLGGVAGAVLLAMAYPGVKGPQVTEGQVITAFVAGSILGGLIPIVVWRWRARRATAAWSRNEPTKGTPR